MIAIPKRAVCVRSLCVPLCLALGVLACRQPAELPHAALAAAPETRRALAAGEVVGGQAHRQHLLGQGPRRAVHPHLPGQRPVPPEDLRVGVLGQIRTLRGMTIQGGADNFRLTNLEAQFNTHNELFNRRLRQREEGATGRPTRRAGPGAGHRRPVRCRRRRLQPFERDVDDAGTFGKHPAECR